MSRKRFDTHNCSIAGTLELVGDWWTLLVVREAFFGSRTFTQFLQNLGISRNILTDRLEKLVEADILEKHYPKAQSQRAQYILTHKGKALLPVLVSMMQWGDQWVNEAGGAPVKLSDLQTGEHLRTMQVETENLKKLDLDQLAITPGPGASTSTLKRFE